MSFIDRYVIVLNRAALLLSLCSVIAFAISVTRAYFYCIDPYRFSPGREGSFDNPSLRYAIIPGGAFIAFLAVTLWLSDRIKKSRAFNDTDAASVGKQKLDTKIETEVSIHTAEFNPFRPPTHKQNKGIGDR